MISHTIITVFEVSKNQQRKHLTYNSCMYVTADYDDDLSGKLADKYIESYYL